MAQVFPEDLAVYFSLLQQGIELYWSASLSAPRLQCCGGDVQLAQLCAMCPCDGLAEMPGPSTEHLVVSLPAQSIA